MRTLTGLFIMLALVILSPVIGTLIAVALALSLIMFPIVLALRVAQLILKPFVFLIEMMLVKAEGIFLRVYDAVFHRHGALAH